MVVSLSMHFAIIRRYSICLFTETLVLIVTITPGTGTFEVCDKDSRVVASGQVTMAKYDETNSTAPAICRYAEQAADQHSHLTSADIYQELWLRGYEYGPAFKVFNNMHLGEPCKSVPTSWEMMSAPAQNAYFKIQFILILCLQPAKTAQLPSCCGQATG